MKNDRQELLLQIINDVSVETQEQLLEELRRRGIESTQATISRDIKQLHLLKVPTGDGTYHYATSLPRNRLNFADRLRNIFHQTVVSVDYAQNLVIIKTMVGMANAAAAALDSVEQEQIVGSLAGDDTVLVVLRDTATAAEFCAQVKEQLQV